MPKTKENSRSSGSRGFPWTKPSDRPKGKQRERDSSHDSLFSEPSSSPQPQFESTTGNATTLGYEVSSPLPPGGVLVNPPIEPLLPNETPLEATPHNYQLSCVNVNANANAEDQDTAVAPCTPKQILQQKLEQMSREILRLLLRMMDTVDEAKVQHMQNWFNEQNRVKFWRPNKPLASAVCHMAIKNAQKMAEHLYRCHSPDKTDYTKTCCGCVFPNQEKEQRHVNRDHPKRQIRLQHSDYTGLSEEALAILFLDEPHFSLVDTLSGNNPKAKGRMLNLIADARPDGRPLMVLKRKKGFRVNNRVSMVCCGICATPRSNVQEMALHLNSDHLKHQGFGCPDENCKKKFSSFDSLQKHADDIHDVQLKSHRVKVANDRRLSVNLSAQEDGSNQMKTKSESSGRDRMSLVSSSSSSTSPSPQTTPIQADTGEGRNATSSTQQQRRQMEDLPIVDQAPLQSTDRQGPVSDHGLADLSGPWPVRPQQPDLASGEQPPPLPGHSPPTGTTHTLHQSHPLYSIAENGRYNVYTSPHTPSHSNYTQANNPYVDPQLQNPIGRQTHVVGPSRISDNSRPVGRVFKTQIPGGSFLRSTRDCRDDTTFRPRLAPSLSVPF